MGYGVMVTLQILVLPFLVRVRVAQQRVSVLLKLFFCICGSPAPIKKADALAPALICLWYCLLLQSFADKLNKSILQHCSYLGYRLATHWNEEQGRDACDIEVVRKLG